MRSYGRLENKVAVITGAASGIGRATVLLFAREGAKVVAADVNHEALNDLVSEVEKEGGTAIAKKTDVSVEAEVKDLIDYALGRFSQVDIVCNNAGIVGDLENVDGFSGQNWLDVYGVNVMGAVYAVKYAAKHMQERKRGSIVNTSSVAGIRSGAGTNAYSASKAALINFTQTVACDLGESNIRVNAVCPGLIQTGMTQPFFDIAIERGKEDKLGSRCELKRYGLPDEIAQAILFLASDDASYITGQALPVDGGNTASLNLPGMKF
ncbi:MAG: SDR family oxidoreductase [Proteobacteria bacterium]|nr:SDR family oxidoreductase [Pseudomonadota bacterium]